MLDGSWLMAQGSWLMAKGGQGRLMAHGSWPRGAGPALGPEGAPGPAGSGPGGGGVTCVTAPLPRDVTPRVFLKKLAYRGSPIAYRGFPIAIGRSRLGIGRSRLWIGRSRLLLGVLGHGLGSSIKHQASMIGRPSLLGIASDDLAGDDLATT